MGNAVQSRRQAREARRKRNLRKWVAFCGAGVILLSGGALAYSLSDYEDAQKTPSTIPSACSTVQRISVETTETMAEVLEKMPVDSQDCIALNISYGAQARDIAYRIVNGKSVPNLWIPDSSTRAELALTGKANVVTVSDSLAKTPAVIISRNDAAPRTWNAALSDHHNIAMGDPKEDSAAFAALLSASAEVSQNKVAAEELTFSTGIRAQTIGMSKPAPKPSESLAQVKNEMVSSAIVTESDYARYTRENPNSGITAHTPASGTIELNYPLYQPATGKTTNRTVNTAADKITRFISSAEGQKALEEAGLRTANNRELATHSTGNAPSLSSPDPRVTASMWSSYLRRSAPANVLLAIDSSESMGKALDGGGKTRMEVATQAISESTGLFPERDSMGLWTFAHRIAGEKNYRELVPIGNLAKTLDGSTQREVLLEHLSKVTPSENSLTELHDAVLAAFREVKANYQVSATNVVVIVTDGEESNDSSISEEELIKTIQAEQNADSPVYFVFIGVSDEADMDGLIRLANQVGGEAFPASSAEDMREIFKETLSYDGVEGVAE